MKTNKRYILKVIIVAVALIANGCADFLDVKNPTTQIGSQSVFEDDATANSAMIGIYSEMTNSSGFASGGLSSITLLAGRSADDFVNYSQGPAAEFAVNELTENNSFVNQYLWTEAYTYIYDANAILEGVSRSTHLSAAVKSQLTGEVKFIRAFCYFYLVNFFKEVPLLTGTDYRINSVASRSPVDVIYEQIVEDLTQSKELLKGDYSASGDEKTRANKLVAIALLSRVYLFQEQWEKAEAEATELIGSSLTLEGDLDDVFLKNSGEAIWQLIPPKGSLATREGSTFILTEIPTEVSLSTELLDSFEQNDLRRSQWVSSVDVDGQAFEFPFKYKVKYGEGELTEYSMVLRLAEQYLIRAEARAHQDKLDLALEDIDAIRHRAGLPLLKDTHPSISQSDLLIAIQQERRVELFSEWGHRWLDLKRTGQTDPALTAKPGASWQPSDAFYPVPLAEIQNNKNLLPQNPGY